MRVRIIVYGMVAGVVALSLLIAGIVWWRYVPITDGDFVIENDAIAWHFRVHNGILETTQITQKESGINLPVTGEDFRLRIGPSASIGYQSRPSSDGVDFLIRENRWVTPESFIATWLIRSPGKRTLVLEERRENGVKVYLEFDVRQGTPWLRRTLSVKGPRTEEYAIDRADHMQWHVNGKVSHGGRGQPLFIDDTWFLALEHPNSSNFFDHGIVTLQQYPGYRFDRDGISLQTAVIGADTPGAVHATMNAYISHLRRPIRSLSLYNTWCDMRGDQLTEKNVLATAQMIKQRLAPHNFLFDAFVIDDGWQNPQSLWEPHSNRFPNGMAPVFSALHTMGFGRGLWVSLSGVMLDIKWGEQQGFESACPEYFCLSAETYNHALRARMREIQNNYAIDFFKHDFNYFVCTRIQHGHFAGHLQSSEVNIDALFTILEEETARNPDLILAVTSGLWPSPWWLSYCDIIWMGGKDHDFDRSLPASRQSVFEMNYRDGRLYQILEEDAMVFPLSAFMTHGVVDARHTYYDIAAEDDEGWANHVMNYLGRGTLLREFYISPEKLTPSRWRILAHALRWARSLDDAMARAHFILGNPSRGELFGYRGSEGKTTYISMRNPSLYDDSVSADAVGITSPFAQIVYPYHEYIATDETAQIHVPGESVMQIMTHERPAFPIPIGVRSTYLTGTYNTTHYRVAFPPDKDTSFNITSPVAISEVTVEGESSVRSLSPNEWRVDIPAMSTAPQALRVDAQKELSSGDVTVIMHLPSHIRGALTYVVYTRENAPSFVAHINDRRAIGDIVRGDGWHLFRVPVSAGEHTVQMRVNMHNNDAIDDVKLFFVCDEIWETRTVTVRHDTVHTQPDTQALPLPILQTTHRTSMHIIDTHTAEENL